MSRLEGYPYFRGSLIYMYSVCKICSGPCAVSTLQWMSLFPGGSQGGVPLYSFLVSNVQKSGCHLENVIMLVCVSVFVCVCVSVGKRPCLLRPQGATMEGGRHKETGAGYRKNAFDQAVGHGLVGAKFCG